MVKQNNQITSNTKLSRLVSLLGKILGTVVKEQEGISSFNKIEEIRNLFLNHPINEGIDLPTPNRAVEERIREFVQNQRGFSENRTMRALDRLASVGKLRSESKPTLFDF